jgi:hypothetical protein
LLLRSLRASWSCRPSLGVGLAGVGLPRLRVQLKLRGGEPGPVLGRGAGFWLRGTGVRALRNPGRPTARVRVVTPGQDLHVPVNTPRTSATE